MSINQSNLRYGNFTSSGIYALMSSNRKGDDFGAAALTYIAEKNFERRLGRSITTETNSRPTSWGKLLEDRVFDLLGIEYTLTSKETDVHPTIPFWSGSKDGTKEAGDRAVIDIKCPMTIKSFCELVQPKYDGLDGVEAMNAIRENHRDGDKYYFQLVSNAIINNCDLAELIVYMPYMSELLEITNLAKDNPTLNWMNYIGDDEIPYILDNGYYSNVNVIRFRVPQEDKDALTERVLKAGKMLIDRYAIESKAA